LREAVRQGKPIIQTGDISSIFSSISIIREIHITSLPALEDKLAKWHVDQTLGDALLKLMETLKSYTIYINNFNHSLETLKKLESNSTWTNWVETVAKHPECQTQRLDSFLITPIQRIPRYQLLLRDLVKRTPHAHPDFQFLAQALDKVKQVGDLINQRKEKSDTASEVILVQAALTGYPETEPLVIPGRRLVHKGILSQVEESGDKFIVTEYFWFLFNDLWIKTKPGNFFGHETKYKYFASIPLRQAIVSAPEDTEDLKNSIQVITSDNVLFTFTVKTKEEQHTWVRHLKEAIEQIEEKMKSFPWTSEGKAEIARHTIEKKYSNSKLPTERHHTLTVEGKGVRRFRLKRDKYKKTVPTLRTSVPKNTTQ